MKHRPSISMKSIPRRLTTKNNSLTLSINQGGKTTSLNLSQDINLDRNATITVNDSPASSSSTSLIVEKPTLKDKLPVFEQEQIFQVWDKIMHEMKTTRPNGEMIDHFQVSYRQDLNIIDIHRKILSYFHHQYRNLSQQKLKIRYWEIKIKHHNISLIKHKQLLNKIANLQHEIKTIDSGDTLLKYLTKTLPFLQLYGTLEKRRNILHFGNDMEVVDDNDDLREDIIRHYIEYSRLYYNIDVCQELQKKDMCPVCQEEIDDEYVNSNGSCVCGYIPKLLNARMIKCIGSNSSESDYEDLGNFMLAFARQEATQNVKLPVDLFNDLDTFFRTKKSIDGQVLLSGEEIRKLPLNSNNTRGNTNIKMLESALGNTGHNKLYVEGNLIASLYWGWVIPSLSEMKDETIEIYKVSQPYYHKHKGARESSMNVYFRLYKTIQLIQWRRLSLGLYLEYKFTMRDFRVVETPSIVCDLEDIWRAMCCDIIKTHSNWKYLPSER